MSVMKTGISWTDCSWNPLRGCSRVSEGCMQCYAEKQAGRFSGPSQPYEGLVRKTSQGFTWTGDVRLIEKDLEQPLKWKTPRRIFVNSMSDLFHERLTASGGEEIRAIFRVMARASQHTFQVLTKRAARMYWWMKEQHDLSGGLTMDDGTVRALPLPNVWLGVSCENQATADERIPWLLKTPAAVRFLSCEPLLGPIHLDRLGPWQEPGFACPREVYPFAGLMAIPDSDWDVGKIDWVIIGGESGPQARPCHVAWFESLLQQCAAAGCACWFKQTGARVVYQTDSGKEQTVQMADRKGAGRMQWRQAWDVQQFPAPRSQSVQLTLVEA